jgi:adenine phosphoribosyltransferase
MIDLTYRNIHTTIPNEEEAMVLEYNLDGAIRKIPDFPKKGILFYDITGILINPEAFQFCVDKMSELYADKKVDAVAAIEARGFIFGAAFAACRGVPLVLVRKKGKLPGETYSKKFCLEYGEDEVEIHTADIQKGWNVLVVDDLIATGGTIKATCEIIEDAEAVVSGIFSVVGLPFLDYQSVLKGYELTTLIDYQSE